MSLDRREERPNGSTGEPSTREWLCVMCKTLQENKAKDNLKQQGFRVYLPCAPGKSKNQGRFLTTKKAMFPGYLFIGADPKQQDLSVVRSTVGCISLLRYGSVPAVVPGYIMESIRIAEEILLGRLEANQGFLPGNKYELLERGFSGHAATFLTLDGKGRARVLLTLLNSEREVKVETSSLGQCLS